MLRFSLGAAAPKGRICVKRLLKMMLGVSAVCAAMLISTRVQAQDKTDAIAYGANAAAGHYLSVDDAKIYYEIYGSGGTPLVLLHGGLYGYIEEFGELIGEMSKNRRVIAIATRGHGRSELGTNPFSYAFVERLNAMESGPVYVTDEQIRSIKAPALIVAGDHDPYNQTAKFVELFQLLPNGELAVIPGCGHVVLDCKGQFTIAAVAAFLNKQGK
jgi:pimeloyl-ACP methyl ester carboxylesterase